MACEFLTVTRSNYIRVILASLGRVRLKMTNQKILPYNLYNDTIRHKLELLINNRPSYLPNVSGHVYGNFGAGDVELSEFKTNKYGVASWTYPTNSIPNKNINTSEYWAVAYYEGQNITSNIVRDNYIKYFDALFFQSFIYDAGTCDTLPYVETSGYVPPSGWVEPYETCDPEWLTYPNYTTLSIGDVNFWGDLLDQSIFENQTQLKYIDNEGILMVTSDSANDSELLTLSGNFRVTTGYYLDTTQIISHGITASGNNNILDYKWHYNGGVKDLFLQLNEGSKLFQVTGATDNHIDVELSYDVSTTTITAKYDIGPSGSWTIGYTGVQDLGDQITIGFDYGHASSDDAGYRYFLFEDDGTLPSSGEPYTDYNTWFYDDFEPDPWATGVWLDMNPSVASGVGYISSGDPATGDQLSSTISGDFVLDVRVWGTPPEEHGVRMQSSVGYIYVGSSGVEPNTFIYDNDNGSYGEIKSGIITSSYYWVRIKATYDVSGHYETLWSNGYDYPSQWYYLTDAVTGNDSNWYLPLGSGLGDSTTPVYMSVTSADDWGISSLRLSTSDELNVLSSGTCTLNSGYYVYSGYYYSGEYLDFDRSLFYIYDASGLNRTDYTIIDRMAGYSGIPTS